MRSKGSRFTLGVWVELCSPDVAQPSATVRNQPFGHKKPSTSPRSWRAVTTVSAPEVGARTTADRAQRRPQIRGNPFSYVMAWLVVFFSWFSNFAVASPPVHVAAEDFVVREPPDCHEFFICPQMRMQKVHVDDAYGGSLIDEFSMHGACERPTM